MISFLYLVLVCLGFGYGAWKILGLNEEDRFAKFFLCLASGIVIFVQISVVLGAIGTSIWYIYLALALGMFVIAYRGLPRIEFSTPDMAWILVLVIFLVHFYVYASGAFNYPWLEDDDPWVHAAGVRYVSIYSTYIQPTDLPLHYLVPYPPFFDVILGTAYQVDGGSVAGMLKFFNAFLVSLTIPIFYAFAKRKFDGTVALWATFILAILPSFMSHFIWAQTLAMLVGILALYFLQRFSEDNKTWKVIAILTIATVLITQPSTAAIIFAMLAIYAVAQVAGSYLERKEWTPQVMEFGLVLGVALLLAIIEFWGPMIITYGMPKVLNQMGLNLSFITGKTNDTSGGIIYGIEDIVNAPLASKMDQPTGLGLFASILVIVGTLTVMDRFRKKIDLTNSSLMLMWFVFCILGLEGNALPVKMMPHRFWVYLALPVAFLAATGIKSALDYIEANKLGYKTIFTLIVVLGLLYGSAYPKYVVETSQWPPGTSWSSNEQISGYIGLQTLPTNTKVFSFCGYEDLANGMGLFGYSWVKEVRDYKTKSIKDNIDANYAFLKKYGYEYAVIDTTCFTTNKIDEINTKINVISADNRFKVQPQLSNKAFITMKVD